jgi:hypothetical protein
MGDRRWKSRDFSADRGAIGKFSTLTLQEGADSYFA